MRIDGQTRLQFHIQKWLFSILLLCMVGLIAWLSQQHHWQTDWTANERNSLSSGSIELLDNLPGEVSINIYSRDDPTLAAAVEEIMNRYKRVKENFEHRMINPDVDIELAQIDGVTQYGEVVVRYDGKRETISSLSEQAISSALLRLSREQARSFVFLHGHGERDPAITDNRGYSKLSSELTSQGHQITSLNLLEEPIPENTGVLVIAGPAKDILPGEVEQILQHITDGGNLLWMMDPGDIGNLSPVAEALGVKFHAGMVVDNNVDLRKTLRIEHPAIIPVLEYYPHPINKDINYNTLFPLSRGIETAAGENQDWEHSVLWRSYERSWSESSGLSSEIVFSTDDGDIAGPITLAIAIERIITDESAHKATQRVVVTGDTDFMANAYIGVGANLELATNIFNWLSGDDDLIAVDIKNAKDLQLKLTDTQIMLIGAGFLIVIPLALIISGFTIWRRRKRS